MTSRKILKRAMLLPLAVILLLLSTLLYTQVFAKYFTQDQSSDSATAAHFDIREDLKDQSASVALIPWEDFQVTVSNHSEVDVECTLSVVNKTNNLPITIAPVTITIEAGNTANRVIKIDWGNAPLEAKYAGQVDLIEVSLTCEQID